MEKQISQLNIQQISPEKEVLTFSEAVELSDVSSSYMYKMTSSRKIPHYKPSGNKIYFNRSELKKWVFRNRVKTDSDIEAEAISYITMNKKY